MRARRLFLLAFVLDGGVFFGSLLRDVDGFSLVLGSAALDEDAGVAVGLARLAWPVVSRLGTTLCLPSVFDLFNLPGPLDLLSSGTVPVDEARFSDERTGLRLRRGA